MDQLARHREIARLLGKEYVQWISTNGDIKVEIVIDHDLGHYEALHIGWPGERCVHGSVIHLDIIDGKVWIQRDGTNRPVADALLEAGVPHEEIVRGFHPPDIRQYTEFAAA